MEHDEKIFSFEETMGIEKEIDRLLSGPTPNEMRIETIEQMLLYCGFVARKQPGSHKVFRHGTDLKTIVAKSGQLVTKPYINKVKRNLKAFRKTEVNL